MSLLWVMICTVIRCDSILELDSMSYRCLFPASPLLRLPGYYRPAFGLGYGTTFSLLLYSGVLAESLGPGCLFSVSCARIPMTFLGGMLAFVFCFLHMFWHILSFRGYRERNWRWLAAIVLSHFVCALVTLVNMSPGDHKCLIPLITVYLFLIVTAAATGFFTVLSTQARSSNPALRPD
mmetsp:Transcript_34532/g.86747  ORF Transcript_34532/g.86747 Transcript_34532/m.86747 type:complete len:179 (-) Transcript_34532:35-571(-)